MIFKAEEGKLFFGGGKKTPQEFIRIPLKDIQNTGSVHRKTFAN